MTTLRICSCVLVNAREELRFIFVQKHFHSTFLSAYHSVLLIVCFIKRAVFTSKALMLELMAESLHPEIAQLIRCKNYSSKDLPPVAAPNHIGLESKICESLNYFGYTSIRSFSNVLLEPESRAKLVGGQNGGLSEEHIFSSHHMFFGQGL